MSDWRATFTSALRLAGSRLAIAVPCVCAVTATAGDWPAFRGSMARTGYVDAAIGLPSSEPRWVLPLGCEIVSSPAIAGGVLYIGGRDSCVHAVDVRTGKLFWRTKTRGWVDSSPLVADATVVVGSRDGLIYSLDRRTGAVRSTLAGGLQISSPALTGDGVLLSGTASLEAGGGLIAFKPSSLTDVRQRSALWSVAFPQVSYSSPAVWESMAVIGQSGGTWYGVDLLRRAMAWSLKTDGEAYLSTAGIADGVAYFAAGNNDRTVYAVDARTGAVQWRSAPAGAGLPKAAAGMRTMGSYEFNQLRRHSPAQRLAVIADLRRRGVYVPPAFDARGLPRARADVAASEFTSFGRTYTSSVAVGPQAVYVARKESGYPAPQFALVALNRETGREMWRFTDVQTCAAESYAASPLVTRNLVVTGWGGGRIYGLDPATGDRKWADTLEGDIVSSPAIADGRLFVATMSGNIYAFDADRQRAAGPLLKPAVSNALAGSVRLQFGLAERERVVVEVFTADGRLWLGAFDGTMNPGNHSIVLSRRSLGAGSYVIRLRIGGAVTHLRMPVL